jgi:hypothetical protein
MFMYARITMKRGQGGVRARLYELAGQYHVMRIRDELPIYFRKGDAGLYVDLYFTSSESAGTRVYSDILWTVARRNTAKGVCRA